MGDVDKVNKLAEWKNNFEQLQLIAFRDIYINGFGLRILGIHFIDYSPSWSSKKHKHSFFEFHYVTEYDVYTTINGIEQKIKAGQFYIMPPGTYHSHRQDSGTGHIGFALRWEAIVREDRKEVLCQNASLELNKIYNALIMADTSIRTDTDRKVLEKMMDLLKKGGEGAGMLELQLAFLEVIIAISKSYSVQNPAQLKDVNSSFLENNIVNDAIKFIEENYTDEIDVDDVSGAVHMSYSHLARIFKKYTGKTINYHINSIRLSKAQKLLRCSGKSIDQVAREVGFNSVYYFCNSFKKFYGISPGSYRTGEFPLSE